MEKQKKILLITLPIVALLNVLTIVLMSLKLLSLNLFIACFCPLLALLAINIVLLILLLKKIKKQKMKKLENKSSGDGNILTDLYEALGIPVQYNKDGTIKDIYELLGIEPEFDEEGNRLLTIYELLGIIPRFSQDGKEIASVIVIKNRVKRFAKVDLSARVLTRKLTEAEKEEKFIKETLQKKIDEAAKNGDKEKAEAIKKVLDDKKKAKAAQKKPAAKAPDKPKYAIGKSSGALKAEKLDKMPNTFKDNVFRDALKFAASKKKPAPKPPKKTEPEKPAEPTKPVPTTSNPQPPKKESSGMISIRGAATSARNDQGSASFVNIRGIDEMER